MFGRSQAKLDDLRASFPTVKGSLAWDLRAEAKAEEYQRYLTDNGIKTVINAVGAGIGNPLPFLSQPELTEMVEANLVSPYMILKHSILPLKRLDGGRVIMFGSITSIHAEEGASGYSATKMALRGLVEASRRELKNGFQSVSVHGVYTGNSNKVRMTSIVEAVAYLSRLPCGVHSDVVIN